jgi:hypothetical protein
MQNISSSTAFPDGDNNGAGDVYINPTVWTDPGTAIGCEPPCTLILPPYPLATPSVVSWSPYVTSVAATSGGTVYTKETTIEIPEFTISAIPFWAITVDVNVTVTVLNPVQSVIPPSLTLLLPSTEAAFPVSSIDYTSQLASETPSISVSTPAAVQTGMVLDCTQFYFSVGGDNCVSVAGGYGLSEAQFIAWNPAVGSTCTNFWISEYYCKEDTQMLICH